MTQLELDVVGPRGRMKSGEHVVCTADDPQCREAIHEQPCTCAAWDPASLTLGAALAFTGELVVLHARVRQLLFAHWFEHHRFGAPFDDWSELLSTSERADMLRALAPEPVDNAHKRVTIES